MDSCSSRRRLIPEASRGLRVLLVDEDTSSLRDIASVLDEQFYKVTTIESASVALSMIQGADQFDLVMADTNMRGMDVFTFLSGILLKTDMPVIFMSSNDNMDMARKALVEGACFFFQKPIREQDLINVWQHVYRKRASQEIENQKEEKDSHGRKIVKSDSTCILARNDCHGNGNGQLPIHKKKGNDQNKNCLLDGNCVQESQDTCKEQMMTVEKVKQGESNIIQGIKIMERDYCSGKIELMGLGLVQGDHAKESLCTTQTKDRGKDKQGTSNRERGDLKRRNSKGLKSIEDDCRGMKNTGNSNTKKKSRMKWTPALHLKFMDAICAVGEREPHPQTIQRMMNEPNLTARHIASHLQKYKERVMRINSATDDSPIHQTNMIEEASYFPGKSGFDGQNSMVNSQVPNSKIGAVAMQFTSPVPMPNPGLNVGTSAHYDLHKLRHSFFYKDLIENARSSFPNNFNGVQVANNGGLHGFNNSGVAIGPFSNAFNLSSSANLMDKQSHGFDVNLQDVCQQAPIQEWNPSPSNLQNTNQFPLVAVPELTQERNFSQGLMTDSTSSGNALMSFVDILKLLEEDDEFEMFNGETIKEEDINRYIEWLSTPSDTDHHLHK
ncbi:unnamed protein product [Camellia sinensis]